MSKKVTIEKLIIKIGDKELALKPDEAEELRQVLNELLGEKETTYEYHYHPAPEPRPYRYWVPMYTTTGGTTYAITAKADNSLLSSWSGDDGA
jgi:hypothetical protein